MTRKIVKEKMRLLGAFAAGTRRVIFVMYALLTTRPSVLITKACKRCAD
jgi:hypothetical protein